MERKFLESPDHQRTLMFNLMLKEGTRTDFMEQQEALGRQLQVQNGELGVYPQAVK
jgi:hypothetical protein